MKLAEYKNIYSLENHHFYYTGNHFIFLTLLNKYLPKFAIRNSQLAILDVGCGTGQFTSRLTSLGKVVGVDVSPEALKYARLRRLRVIRANAQDLPFPASSFDLVCCIDVIYHEAITLDSRVLSEIFRVLKPGGLLLLRTPALPALHTHHDSQVFTRQRYTYSQLKTKLTAAHFTITRLTYTNPLFLLPLWLNSLHHTFVSPQPKSGLHHLPKLINTLLIFSLYAEGYFLRSFDLSIGVGLLSVCHKPSIPARQSPHR